MNEFFHVLRLQDAARALQERWPQRIAESVPLEACLGRTLATDLPAHEDLPPFARSTVDGYAVLSQDVFGASEGLPAVLQPCGEIEMGVMPPFSISPEQCAWIPTGGVLPEGADAVVMVEYTEKLGEDTILVSRPAAPGENVIFPGEDCRRGEIALYTGLKIRPQDLGVAAALGYDQLPVLKPLKVGILSTGDEIVPITAQPTAGQIRDVNSHMLAAAVRRHGGQPTLYGIVPDEFDRLRETAALAIQQNDLVLLSGGSSVGMRDLSLRVLQDFEGAELLFHGLSIKPGKPTMGLAIRDRLVIGLPGHPVSALMVFETLAGPLLGGPDPVATAAVLSENVASQPGRDDFVRVTLQRQGASITAVPVYGKAGLIRIMAQADGFVHIPYEKQGLLKGEPVIVRAL
ncbi:MAG: gephyrin-like molybdotransferase Glp [Solirubrobacterales bacterium]